jgi:hypothetical protein
MMVVFARKHMMKHQALTILCMVFGFLQTSQSIAQGLSEYWQRESALNAVRAVDIDRAVYELSDVSSLADAATTLTRLKNMEARANWALPAREAAIYHFTRSLAQLPRDAVAVEVIQHLLDYQARVLVPHEDHDDAYVPLFNIRGAAAGVENAWQRAEFASEAERLLGTDPAKLVSAYAGSANKNQQAAYLEVLKYAGIAEVLAIQDVALQQLNPSPVLTPLVGITAGLTADTYAVERLLTDGRGAGLSSTLVQLGRQLPISETAALLDFAIQHAPPTNAALAISAWWPGLKHVTTIRDSLLELLDDPALGASAALALAQSPDMQTLKILQDMAGDDSSAAKRAQMALELSRDQLAGEVRP